ncbi:MAG TPA: Ig-like domain-containing protein [Flavobacterium sp.]
MKNYRFLILLAIMVLGSCAKRGSITGGLKDTIPPTMIMSVPKNFSTGFKGNTIRLTFDEYIKLKNADKQLIVSPPMKNRPTLTPSTASKYIQIQIHDTLQPNTTYSFNFGQSIEDNNEGNPYPQFKYVFSTGSYIDSLTLGGRIRDAYAKSPDNFVSVMLYEVNDTYTDSTVYKETPRYITNTLDSLTTFTLDYLKPGKYQLIALKDDNGNNRFDPKQDKIAFQREFITIPTDTLYELELFREALPFKVLRPSQASGNRIVMGYEGSPKGIKVALRNGPDIVPTIVTRLPKKDSVQVWYSPVKVDSLKLSVTNEAYSTDFTVKMRAQKSDTLSFSAVQPGTLPLREDFAITASKPIIQIDSTLISVQKADSSAVAFTTAYDEFTQNLTLRFQKEPLQKYEITMLPGALTDFYGQKNDTLTFRPSTKSVSDYGNLRVVLENVRRFPIIIELTNAKGDLIESEYSESATVIDFNAIEPMRYTLRVIYDDNGNKQWDPGNFLEKRQSEEVQYFLGEINVPAYWEVDQTFTLP